MSITEETIGAFRKVVQERFGLHFDETRTDQLVETLKARVAETRSVSPAEYVNSLRNGSEREWQHIIERLTVPETFFFRVPEHLAALQNHVIPDLIHGAGKRLRILSLGCASGEEAYTLAMLLSEMPALANTKFELTGIDVNPAALAKAENARYTDWSLREIPSGFRERYFRKLGRREYQLSDAIRRMVKFESGNLHELDLRARYGLVDVIFMRNVLMYFATEAARDLMERVADVLRPAGYLFLAPAESLRGVSQRFSLCHTDETFYYRLRASELPQTAGVGHRPAPPAMPEESGQEWYNIVQRSTKRIHALRIPDKADLTPLQRQPAKTKTNDVAIAMELHRAGDAAAAWKHLQQADGITNDPDAMLLKAVLLTNSGKADEAEQECRRLLRLDELNAGAHYLLALCREQKGDRAGALEQDETATYLDPLFAMPFLHRGLLARRAGDMDKACGELKRARELLASETSSRILLFGGGFGRQGLFELCERELRACGKAI